MKRVALINMPFSSVQRSSLSLGLLKKSLELQDIPTDVYYLNIRFAKYLDLAVYETICTSINQGEWFFSEHLFGRFGTGEIKRIYDDLMNELADKQVSNELYDLTQKFGISLKSISEEIVPSFINECIEDIPWDKYDVVGFSTSFSQHISSLLLAKKIKNLYPNIKIIFGGANVRDTMGIETLRAFDWVDYVIDGEGEEVLPLLVKNIFNGLFYESIAGVSFRDGNKLEINQNNHYKQSLDDLPVPDFSEYYMELEQSGLRDIVPARSLIEFSRGCWWGEKSHCMFCGGYGQYMKFRTKSPEKIISEILELIETDKTKMFFNTDSILDLKFLETLYPDIIDMNLGLDMFIEVRSILTKKQLKTLFDAGVKLIQPGIESLNSAILKLMCKGITALQNIQFLKYTYEIGIDVAWSLLYGIPGEKQSDYDDIIALIPSIIHLQPPHYVIKAMLQRYSPFFDNALQYGVKNIKPDFIYYHIYPEEKVNIDNMAYFFTYTDGDFESNPKEYIEPIKNAICYWQELFFRREAFLNYKIDSDILEITDRRPSELYGKVDASRKYRIEGVKKDIYIFCDEIRAFYEIYKFTNKEDNTEMTEEELQKILDEFVQARFMVVENGRYLSIATRIKSFE